VGFLFGILKYCYIFALTNQLNYLVMKSISVSFYAKTSDNKEVKLEQNPFVEVYLKTPKETTLICVN
jgi:adenylylsulfate kinase-like enzyme